MDKKRFNEILKKSFGKEKDEKYHAIAMLTIYMFFFIILVIFFRLNHVDNKKVENKTNTNDNQGQVEVTPSPSPSSNTNTSIENDKSDVNYSYSYRVTFDNNTEVYLGKRIDDKQKFSYIKDGVTYEYAILDDNYLKLDGDNYHIIDRLDTYFKYCDVEKIIELTGNEVPIQNGNIITYNVNNLSISKQFNENLLNNNNRDNIIQLSIDNNQLKAVSLDFSNYISSVFNEEHSLIINMEFANIGTTENFEIKMN